jgi:hypothetical protein
MCLLLLKKTTSEPSDNDDRAMLQSGTTASTETSNVALLHSLMTNDTGCPNVPEEPIRKTTDLHQACSSAWSLDDIRAALRENPTATTVHDENGTLPLHHIAENEALYLEESLQAARDKLDTFIIDELLPRCPLAPNTTDDQGHVPFSSNVFKWVMEMHKDETNSTASSRVHPESNAASDSEAPVIEETSIDELIPSMVITLNPFAEWYLAILSRIVDLSATKYQDVVLNVASIPSLVKSLLLIKEEKG